MSTYHELYNIRLLMFTGSFEVEQSCHNNHVVQDISTKWARNMFMLWYSDINTSSLVL